MKEAIAELLDTIEKSYDCDPWVKDHTIESYKDEVVSEAEEVVQAIENKDYENLKEEIGDLLYDVMMLAVIAEKAGHFDLKDSIKSIVEKIKRRKPYIEEGREVTKEEARRIWLEVKEKEKSER